MYYYSIFFLILTTAFGVYVVWFINYLFDRGSGDDIDDDGKNPPEPDPDPVSPSGPRSKLPSDSDWIESLVGTECYTKNVWNPRKSPEREKVNE